LGIEEALLSTSSLTINIASRRSDALSGKISATLAGRTSNYLPFFMKRSMRMPNLFFNFSIKVLEVHSPKLSENLMKLILSFLMASVKATFELKTNLKSVFGSCFIF
jgi:hypothetical protein